MTFIERCKEGFHPMPAIWDIKELWNINATRGRFFNQIFLPMYILILPAMLLYSLLMAIEVWSKGEYDEKKTTQEK
jgi:hypothetical protein